MNGNVGFCQNCDVLSDTLELGVCDDCFEQMPMDEWVSSWDCDKVHTTRS